MALENQGLTLILSIYVFRPRITMQNEQTTAPAPANDLLVVTGLAIDVLRLPFDVARAQYARAVQLGLVQRSMLASRDFARTLGALEKLALGPWARHV